MRKVHLIKRVDFGHESDFYEAKWTSHCDVKLIFYKNSSYSSEDTMTWTENEIDCPDCYAWAQLNLLSKFKT